jgi:hypothetical protein
MTEPYNQLDVLRHIEKLAEETNASMQKRGKGVLRRYPLTFTILILIAVVLVSEGIKVGLEEIGLLSHPFYSLLIGLIILLLTGTLYKKLEK